ncbi:MAG: hypothetical protein AAB838_03765 [Patescibacteria group bacterium]
MNFKRGNVLIIIPSIIAVVALIAAGYFFYQNQQLQKPVPVQNSVIEDEMGSGKTYKSKDGLYQISYPENWTVNDTNGVSIGGKNRIDIGILVHSDSSEEYVKSQWQSVLCGSGPDGNGCPPNPNKETKMSKVGGNIVYWKIDGNGQMRALIPNVVKNKTVEIYSVSLKDKNLFDQILGTFRFL